MLSSPGLASNDSGECEIQNTVMNILKNTVNSSEEPLDFTSTFDDVEPISKLVILMTTPRYIPSEFWLVYVSYNVVWGSFKVEL